MTFSHNIRPAVDSDIPFLARAVLLSERARWNRGIWELFLGMNHVEAISEDEEKKILEILQEMIAKCTTSPWYLGRFFVLEATKDGDDSAPSVAACASCFLYPQASLSQCKEGLREPTKRVFGWSDEEFDKAWEEKIGLVGDGFPEDVEYDGAWMVDGVYVDPRFRGCGFGVDIVRFAMREGKKQNQMRVLLSCALGNTPAEKMYIKIGMAVAGEGYSEKLGKELDFAGYKMMQLTMTPDF